MAVVARELFYTLVRPHGLSSLSDLIARGTWRGFRQLPVGLLHLGGPAILTLTISGWAVMLAIGWALIYWPALPNEFLIDSGLSASAHGGFGDALYLSLVTMATLGYGDIAPRDTWLRLAAPAEALMGFLLLTAAITWLLAIYPAIGRQRALSREVDGHLQAMRDPGEPNEPHPVVAALRLEDLAAKTIAVHGDLDQFPTTYYFRAIEDAGSLPLALQRLDGLAGAAGGPEVRASALRLQIALAAIARLLSERYVPALRAREPRQVFEACAHDHRHE